MRVSFETALRVVAEVQPPEVIVEANAVAVAAADTEKTVVQAGTWLPEMMLVVDSGTADQKTDTDSGESGSWLVDWAKRRATCNN